MIQQRCINRRNNTTVTTRLSLAVIRTGRGKMRMCTICRVPDGNEQNYSVTTANVKYTVHLEAKKPTTFVVTNYQ
jgi:hypothetical protein